MPQLDLWVLWLQSDTIDTDMRWAGKSWGTKKIDNNHCEIDVAVLVCCGRSLKSNMLSVVYTGVILCVTKIRVGWLCWMPWPDGLLNMCVCVCVFFILVFLSLIIPLPIPPTYRGCLEARTNYFFIKKYWFCTPVGLVTTLFVGRLFFEHFW